MSLTIDEIMKIIDDSFDEHIMVHTAETVFGTEVWMEGKTEFFQQIREKLGHSSNG